MLIIVLVAIFFSGFFLIYEARYFVGRASITARSFSVENSYLFVSPLNAKANGDERIRVTVFILNDQGLGVLGRSISLSSDINLTQETVQGLTDAVGKAVFDIQAKKPGDYYLDVKVDGTGLPQKARLVFF